MYDEKERESVKSNVFDQPYQPNYADEDYDDNYDLVEAFGFSPEETFQSAPIQGKGFGGGMLSSLSKIGGKSGKAKGKGIGKSKALSQVGGSAGTGAKGGKPDKAIELLCDKGGKGAEARKALDLVCTKNIKGPKPSKMIEKLSAQGGKSTKRGKTAPLQGKGFRGKKNSARQVGNLSSGKALSLSSAMSEKIRSDFGIDPKNISLRESPDVAKMGAKATAQGNIIRFAPGEYNPDTMEGRKTLGHELNHVREQALGKVRSNVEGTNIHYDPSHEATSDRVGEAFASGTLSSASPVSIGNASVGGAPASAIQGIFGRIRDGVNNIATSALNKTSHVLGQVGSAVGGRLSNAVENGFDRFGNKIRSTGEFIGGQASAASDRLREKDSRVGNVLANGLDHIGEGASIAGSALGDRADSLGERAANGLRNVTGRLTGGRDAANFPMEANLGEISNEDHRHMVLVHGTVLTPGVSRIAPVADGYDHEHWDKNNPVRTGLQERFGIDDSNVHVPDWGGHNNPDQRIAGGELVADYLRHILSSNPEAEILLAGYSHGGNVAKLALNLLQEELDAKPEEERQFNLNNVTLLGSGTPALENYQLNENSRENIRDHLNFYNQWDAVQQDMALIGSTGDRVRVEGHEVGRAQHNATNISVTGGEVGGIPRGAPNINISRENGFQFDMNNVGGFPAHSAMLNNDNIWNTYMHEHIEAKGW